MSTREFGLNAGLLSMPVNTSFFSSNLRFTPSISRPICAVITCPCLALRIMSLSTKDAKGIIIASHAGSIVTATRFGFVRSAYFGLAVRRSCG